MLKFVHAFEESLTQTIDISRGDDDTNPHFGTLDGKGRVRLEYLYTLRHLDAKEVCMSTYIWYRTRAWPNLAFRILVCAHGVARFRHRLFDDADRIRCLRSRVYALLGDESGDLAPEGRDVVFSLFLSDLHFAFAEDLCYKRKLVKENTGSWGVDQGRRRRICAYLSSDRISVLCSERFFEVVRFGYFSF